MNVAARHRLVSIELHDVAPTTWPSCAAMLERLDAIGASHTTLLVVPFYHRRVRLDEAPAFVDAISARIARADEVALHGFVHLDEAAAPRTVRGIVERRILTRREGEFAAIEADDARDRLNDAVAIWRRTGWPLRGFVPPAWLLGRSARAAAVSDGRFGYIGLRRALVPLPVGRPIASDVLWYSPTSTPRRWLSRACIAITRARASRAPLLRIALHPRDAEVSGVLDHWQRIIARELQDRTPMTTSEALATLAPPGGAHPVRDAHSQYGVAL